MGANSLRCLSIHFPTNFFGSKVEKDSACTKATTEHYPNSCHFRDILELIKTRPTTDSWNPSSLTLVKEAYCQKHKKMCFGFTVRMVRTGDWHMYTRRGYDIIQCIKIYQEVCWTITTINVIKDILKIK